MLPRIFALARGAFWRWALLVFLLLTVVWLARAPLPPPASLDLRLTLAAAPAGRSDPLVVTGHTGAADFCYVRRVAPDRIVFGYDSWGAGGPESAPLPYRPDTAVALRLDLPALSDPFTHSRGQPPPRLRLEYDGRVIFDQEVHFHGHPNPEVRFAVNPVGGTTCGPLLAGRLTDAAGREWLGPLRLSVAWPQRLPLALRRSPGAVPVLALLALALVAAARGSFRLLRSAPSLSPWWREHRVFLLVSAGCTFLFAGLLTGWRGDLLYAENFGDVYDYQAAALLGGRLDLPRSVIENEAFVVAGRSYIYFGPTPALARLPWVLFDVGFGRLSRGFFLVYYLAGLTATYALLRHVWRRVRGAAPLPAALTGLLLLNAGLGSTLLYLGSRVYVYHEAILGGCALALWSAYASLRQLAAGDDAQAGRHAGGAPRKWWLIAWVLGVLAVHTRPTAGLFALGLLGTVAGWQIWTALRPRLLPTRAVPGESARPPALLAAVGRPLTIGLLALAGLLSFNGLSYVKFGSFEGAPLRYHVQYDAARLARIEGRNFHLANLPRNAGSYFTRWTGEWRPTYPFLFCHGTPRSQHPQARIDLDEPMLALPYAMPGLCLLALGGGLYAAWREPRLRLPLGVLTFAATPVVLALLAAVATAHRYTGDFCPLLLPLAAGGAVGLAALRPRWRRLVGAALALATVAAILAGTALAVSYQGEGVWGAPDAIRRDFADLRRKIDHFVLPSR